MVKTMQGYTYVCTCIHTQTDTKIYTTYASLHVTYVHTHTQTQTQIHTHRHTHTDTHTQTHRHTDTQTHTHTHTHTHCCFVVAVSIIGTLIFLKFCILAILVTFSQFIWYVHAWLCKSDI